MSTTHNFKVRGNPIIIAHGNVIMVLSVLKLTDTSLTSPLSVNPRVLAIKMLRMQTGLGLFEAKCIVDLLADKGKLDRYGEPTIDRPQFEAEYCGKDD